MLCERIIGRLSDIQIDPAHRHKRIVHLTLTWQHTQQRAIRAKTEQGRTIRILLPPGQTLSQDDVVAITDDQIVAVVIEPVELLCATANSPEQLAQAVYELGCLHLPVQVQGMSVLTLDDGPALTVFRRLNLPVERTTRPFTTLRLASETRFQTSSSIQIRRG